MLALGKLIKSEGQGLWGCSPSTAKGSTMPASQQEGRWAATPGPDSRPLCGRNGQPHILVSRQSPGRPHMQAYVRTPRSAMWLAFRAHLARPQFHHVTCPAVSCCSNHWTWHRNPMGKTGRPWPRLTMRHSAWWHQALGRRGSHGPRPISPAMMVTSSLTSPCFPAVSSFP